MRRRIAPRLLIAGYFALAAATLAPAQQQQQAGKPFSMLVVSDPQYPWTWVTDKNIELEDLRKSCAANPADTACSKPIPPNLPGDDIPTADRHNTNLRAYLDRLIAANSQIRGVIFNGDLTNYGHDWHLTGFKQFYDSLKVTRFLGLGNHDYQNNVEKTRENLAATRMVEYLRDEVRKLPVPINFDYSERAEAGKFFLEGSLAYSWDIEHIHFVQLNNYPLYEASWGNYRSDRFTWVQVNIKNSLSWLEKDLTAARSKGQAIILNLHDADDPWKGPDPKLQSELNRILTANDVTAVFAGHHHTRLGRNQSKWFDPSPHLPLHVAKLSQIPQIPVFYSSAASQDGFLSVAFNATELRVSKVHSFVKNGHAPGVPFDEQIVPLKRSAGTASCAPRTFRSVSEHTWVEFRMPAAALGTTVSIPAGAHGKYVFPKCNRVWWDNLTFGCRVDGWALGSGKYDADAYCTGTPGTSPYVAYGDR